MMLFGEREDDFPEIDLLDNHSKKTEDMSKFETIIGARNSVTGNIEGASPICINGKLIGNINSTSYVYISKTGSVEGSVTADHLVLLGNITGDSINAGKLVVTATGVVNSDQGCQADRGGGRRPERTGVCKRQPYSRRGRDMIHALS